MRNIVIEIGEGDDDDVISGVDHNIIWREVKRDLEASGVTVDDAAPAANHSCS